MFSNVKRNAKRVCSCIQCNFDIHFILFHIFTEHPHFAILVERIYNGTFRIVFHS